MIYRLPAQNFFEGWWLLIKITGPQAPYLDLQIRISSNGTQDTTFSQNLWVVLKNTRVEKNRNSYIKLQKKNI